MAEAALAGTQRFRQALTAQRARMQDAASEKERQIEVSIGTTQGGFRVAKREGLLPFDRQIRVDLREKAGAIGPTSRADDLGIKC